MPVSSTAPSNDDDAAFIDAALRARANLRGLISALHRGAARLDSEIYRRQLEAGNSTETLSNEAADVLGGAWPLGIECALAFARNDRAALACAVETEADQIERIRDAIGTTSQGKQMIQTLEETAAHGTTLLQILESDGKKQPQARKSKPTSQLSGVK